MFLHTTRLLTGCRRISATEPGVSQPREIDAAISAKGQYFAPLEHTQIISVLYFKDLTRSDLGVIDIYLLRGKRERLKSWTEDWLEPALFRLPYMNGNGILKITDKQFNHSQNLEEVTPLSIVIALLGGYLS